MLELYLVFFLIGLLAFGGGYVILPLIEQYIVNQNAWISSNTLIDIVAISQITPGPISINAATFVGMNLYSVIGAIVATLAVISPQILILSVFIKYIGLENRIIKKIFDGIYPATVALILIATINIFKNTFTKIEYRGIICFILTFILLKLKIKPLYIMILSALISAFINF